MAHLCPPLCSDPLFALWSHENFYEQRFDLDSLPNQDRMKATRSPAMIGT
jgi:hypothetical protein